MITAYVDTSAAMKLLFEERESAATLAYFTDGPSRRLVSSWLLHTELHCATNRRGTGAVDGLPVVLGMLDLVDLTRGDLVTAGALSPLRSNDAIHLAVALRTGADELVTFDAELADAAGRAGIRPVSPGLGG